MARNHQIQIRKGTATQWSTTNPILVSGEPGFDTTNNLLKIGDGTSTWSSLSSNVGVGDAGLLSIAGLTTGADTYIYTSANDVYTTGTITTFGRSLVDDADASTARTTLGLAIGTNVQAYDAGLQSIAGLTTTSGSYLYTTANDVYTTGTSTVYGRSVLAATGVESLVTTTLAAGTGISFSYSSANDTATISTSGLVIGTNIQAYDAQLTDVAGLTPTDNGVIIGNGTNFVVESAATLKVSLGLTIGTNVLAYNSVLASAFAGGRLTLESGVPISTTDQSAKTTIYYTPYVNSSIGLYDTTNLVWVPYSFTQTSLALGTLSSGFNYDVFMYNNAGTLTLAFSIWTDNTTRATAISLQDGVFVKTSDKSYRYLGTFRTVTTTTTVDTAAQRLLWNYNNRRYKKVYCYYISAHIYSTATWRSWNNTITLGSTRIEFVSGFNEDSISLMYYGQIANGNVALGLDTTTAPSNSSILTEASTTYSSAASAVGAFTQQIGYHFVQGLELGAAASSSFTSFAIESSLLC